MIFPENLLPQLIIPYVYCHIHRGRQSLYQYHLTSDTRGSHILPIRGESSTKVGWDMEQIFKPSYLGTVKQTDPN